MRRPRKPQYLAEMLCQIEFLFFQEQADQSLRNEHLHQGIKESLLILLERMEYAQVKEFCERFEGKEFLHSILPIAIEKCPDVEELVSILALAEGHFPRKEYSSQNVRKKIAELTDSTKINGTELEMMVEDKLAPNTTAARNTENLIDSCRQ